MVRYEERKYHAGLQNGRETPIISSRGNNFVHVQVHTTHETMGSVLRTPLNASMCVIEPPNQGFLEKNWLLLLQYIYQTNR